MSHPSDSGYDPFEGVEEPEEIDGDWEHDVERDLDDSEADMLEAKEVDNFQQEEERE